MMVFAAVFSFSTCVFAVDDINYVFHGVTIDGASESVAYGGDDSGLIVGKFLDETGWHGFIYDISGGGVLVDVLDVPDAFATVAMGINSSGKVVGYCRKGYFGEEAFLYDPDADPNYRTFAKEGAFTTIAYDINDNNIIAGDYKTFTGGFQGFAFIFDPAGGSGEGEFLREFSDLDTGDENIVRIASAFGINNKEEYDIVGFMWQRSNDWDNITYDQFGFMQAFDETVTFIQFGAVPDFYYTDAFGINEAGIVTGNYSGAAAAEGGYILDAGTFYNINLDGGLPAGTVQLKFYGIDDSNKIFGAYMDFFGWHAFWGEPPAIWP